MKVLVTGGAGYIGSHTTVALLDAGHTPIIVDNFANSERWILARIEQITGMRPTLYEGDCADTAFLAQVFNTEKDIEAVIHFAGYKAVGESIVEPCKYYRNNIDSLLAVLETMSLYDCTHLVFSSSATVYGVPNENPISEEAPRKKAQSPYGATKAMCEDIIADTVKSRIGMRATILRYFNPIGAHSSGLIGELPKGVPNNLVPFITQAVAGVREALTIFGNDYSTPDGTCVRDFIHVVDLARAHIFALEHLVKDVALPYCVYNVGTGRGTSVRELVDTFESVNKRKVPYVIGPRRDGDIAECYADVEKIKNEIGWSALYTVEDGMRDAWRWEQEGSRAHE